MRDRKSLYLLIFALAIITISFILISIWGYHFYYSNLNKKPLQKLQNANAKVQKPAKKDSIVAFVNSFSSEMPNNYDSATFDSSADEVLAIKMIEFQKLKSEITEILRKRNSARQMSETNERILELQQNIEELKNKNDTIIRENEKLNQVIKELIEKKEIHSKVKSDLASKKKPAVSPNTLPVLVSHLRFNAFSVNEENSETNIAAKTERLSGSFQLNIKSFNTNTTVYVAIIQPNGKTLLNSSGEAKTFISQNRKKIYSAAIHFNNKKDNGSRIAFSINSHNFRKGRYIMQIYHDGVMIGRLTRTLF